MWHFPNQRLSLCASPSCSWSEPKNVVVCKVWGSAVDAGNQHYHADDVVNTKAVLNFTILIVGRRIDALKWVRSNARNE